MWAFGKSKATGLNIKAIARLSAFALVIPALFASCRSLSPFLRSDGKTELLRYAAADGDAVMYVRAKAAAGLLSKMVEVEPELLAQFEDAVVIADGEDVFGVLEGSIPMIAKNCLIENLGGRKVEFGFGRCYEGFAGGRGFYFDMPYRGVLMFSFTPGGFAKLRSRFVDRRKASMDEDAWERVQSGDVGIYGENPRISANPVFDGGKVSGMMLVATVVESGKFSVDGFMRMVDADALKAVDTIVRNEYAAGLRRSGETADLKMLRSSFRILTDDNCLKYENFVIAEDSLLNLVGGK